MKMSMLVVMTQEEVDRFNAGSKQAALDAAKLNPTKSRPRHSSVIRAELERQKLSLNSVGRMLVKAEETVTQAKAALKQTNDQLAELRKAGFAENSPQVQRLRGSSFRSKVTDLPVHQDGVLDRLNQAISEQVPRLRMLEDNYARDTKRLQPILAALETELAEALRLERLTEKR
jgi:exonuclease VII small subunit